MRDSRLYPVLAVCAVIAAGTPLLAVSRSDAQPATATVMESLIRDVEGVERKLAGLAEAIPESAYGWRPGEGVRSVSEVFTHVAADNYFIPTIAGAEAPASTGIRGDSYATVQAYEGREVTKAEAIRELTASFAHLKRIMEGVDQNALEREVDLFGTPTTGLDLWVLATTHLHEHLGQQIAYARSNGVVPPWSQ